MTLADLTTLRVGGPAALVEASTEQDLIQAVRQAGPGALVIGGGSNLLCAQHLDGITVLRDLRQTLEVAKTDSQVIITATAGYPWDNLVAEAVDQGWRGFEALSGIPGSVGATPVQNIGAYGAEVSQLITSVKAFDRLKGRIVNLTPNLLEMGYRTSLLKRSFDRFAPTPRWVVLQVTFQAIRAGTSAPLAYRELAKVLSVELGKRAPLHLVRQAVLALRRQKGMVHDPADPDTHSAGSFFTNPVIQRSQAERLPPDAPLFDAGPGFVKTSAAWLINQVGVGPGWGLNPRATTSTKHVLALTNRGGATGEEVADLARVIQARVMATFGIRLTPEPILVGFPSGNSSQ
ncbi:MAG: UDP-N-acetylmuramate dehydrogenase [Micrococcales bacterium]|nr:UDP-N-acetylmuramate dehydrogenase [Micrococcales bacterium]